MRPRSTVLIAVIGLACLTRLAGPLAAERVSAVGIYRAQAGALVYSTVSSALLKDPGHPSEASVTITFQLDADAHISNLAIVAEKGGQWAEDTAREAMSKVRFRPASKAVRDELGSNSIEVSTTVGFTSPSE
jgi:hypothetical protein